MSLSAKIANTNQSALTQLDQREQNVPGPLVTLLHRRLLFEGPTSKWLHLRRIIRRSSRQTKQNGQDCSFGNGWQNLVLPAAWADYTDERVLLADRIFHVLLAIEEAKRFSPGALKKWQSTASQLSVSIESKQFLPGEMIASDAFDWISFAWHFTLPWHLVLEQSRTDYTQQIAFVKESFDRLLSQENFQVNSIPWIRLRNSFAEAIESARMQLPGNFLPDLIVLVEGSTEAVLLPTLAKCCNFDLAASGAMIIAAGGANQVVRKYNQLKDAVCIPIFCLLDRDAHEQEQALAQILRREDSLHVLQDGEIEDVFDLDTMVCLLNAYLETLPVDSRQINNKDFDTGLSRTHALEKIWGQRKLGKFDKVGFAEFASSQITPQTNISAEARQLFATLGAFATRR